VVEMPPSARTTDPVLIRLSAEASTTYIAAQPSAPHDEVRAAAACPVHAVTIEG
jgi:hypothetical protein